MTMLISEILFGIMLALLLTGLFVEMFRDDKDEELDDFSSLRNYK